MRSGKAFDDGGHTPDGRIVHEDASGNIHRHLWQRPSLHHVRLKQIDEFRTLAVHPQKLLEIKGRHLESLLIAYAYAVYLSVVDAEQRAGRNDIIASVNAEELEARGDVGVLLYFVEHDDRLMRHKAQRTVYLRDVADYVLWRISVRNDLAEYRLFKKVYVNDTTVSRFGKTLD